MSENEKKKLDITPGVWELGRKSLSDGRQVVCADGQTVARCLPITGVVFDPHGKNADANARFIAEAGTVANETGLTPRQLADQRASLLEACRAVYETAEEVVTHEDGIEKIACEISENVLVKIVAAIARATKESES